MDSSFGRNIKITLFGGSHEPEIGVTIEGLPKGLKIDMEKMETLLLRRAPGNNPFSTSRKEADRPLVQSGLHGGVTFGRPVTFVIQNTDVRKKDYQDFSDLPRPAHADYTAKLKYGNSLPMSGGGPFSGRMTAPLCIAGAIALQILEGQGVFIGSHIDSIGDIEDEGFNPVSVSEALLSSLKGNPFPVLSFEAGEEMKKKILSAKEAGDSIGGVVECCALGFPAGAGGPLFDGIESALSPLFFAIPAVKGVDFGAGFDSSRKLGSQNNDPFCVDAAGEIRTKTNHHGGILGGITSGMPIIARLAFKPTPSISLPQESVRLSSKTSEILTISGRHDPCIVLRALPVAESAMALGLLDILLTDSL